MASIVSAGTTSGTALNMSGDTSGVLQLASNNGTTAVTIDTSQNVGIGVTPSFKLQAYNSSTGDVTVAKFANQGYGTSGKAYIELGGQYGDGGSRIGSFNASGNTSNLIFETHASSSGVFTEQMRIDSSGHVLVNSTTPISGRDERLQIFGLPGSYAAAATYMSATTAQQHFSFCNPNGQVGYVQTNGSVTTYVSVSDYRLKENIVPMTGALATVSRLKPVNYKWKVDGSNGQGFIAHELQEVIPDCVAGDKDAVDKDGNPVYQGIDTSFLVATLTAAIQELKAINDTQAETINALTARVVALESK
jgi:hypothetical protein